MRLTKHLRNGAIALLLFATGCGPKRVAAPPPLPPQPVQQNVFVLLPEDRGGDSGIVVKNQAGAQDLSQPYQAVSVERADVAPSTPFTLTRSDVTRLFGAALEVLPAPEVLFVLHFEEGQDVLNGESLAQLPAILNMIRERHSTAVTVTGHTDTTASHDFNYQLGLRRAQNVAGILRGRGVNDSDLFVSSHGDADLLIQTGPNISEARNRRVEVIVR